MSAIAQKRFTEEKKELETIHSDSTPSPSPTPMDPWTSWPGMLGFPGKKGPFGKVDSTKCASSSVRSTLRNRHSVTLFLPSFSKCSCLFFICECASVCENKKSKIQLFPSCSLAIGSSFHQTSLISCFLFHFPLSRHGFSYLLVQSQRVLPIRKKDVVL